MRGSPYQLQSKGNVVSQNLHEFGGIHLKQMPLIGQQHYPSHLLRRNGRNGDRDLSDPGGNDKQYCNRSGSGYVGPHGTKVVVMMVSQIIIMKVA